jgi:trigger factor
LCGHHQTAVGNIRLTNSPLSNLKHFVVFQYKSISKMKISNVLLALSLLASTDAFFVPQTVAFTNKRALSSALYASTLIRLPGSAVQVEITAPGTATKAAYEKACAELSKTITIPGFRKGSKIPPQVLESNMAAKGGRSALKVQAITSLLAELILPALQGEHGLEPIGQPKLVRLPEEVAEDFVAGQDLIIQVTCDVWPEIQWKQVEGKEKPYLGLSGTYKRAPFDQAKYEKALNDLMERYVTLEPIEDASHELAMGDACVVNMEGYMATETGEKGEPLPNAASGDRVEVILGQGRYMTGLVEGLVDGKVGDTRIVTVTFPMVRLREAYPKKDNEPFIHFLSRSHYYYFLRS